MTGGDCYVHTTVIEPKISPSIPAKRYNGVTHLSSNTKEGTPALERLPSLVVTLVQPDHLGKGIYNSWLEACII